MVTTSDQSFVTTGTSTLDFDEDKVAELTGAYGYTSTVVGGAVTMMRLPRS